MRARAQSQKNQPGVWRGQKHLRGLLLLEDEPLAPRDELRARLAEVEASHALRIAQRVERVRQRGGELLAQPQQEERVHLRS